MTLSLLSFSLKKISRFIISSPVCFVFLSINKHIAWLWLFSRDPSPAKWFLISFLEMLWDRLNRSVAWGNSMSPVCGDASSNPDSLV